MAEIGHTQNCSHFRDQRYIAGMRASTFAAFAALFATATAWAGPHAVEDNAPPPPLDEQASPTPSPDPNGSPLPGQTPLDPLQTPADATRTPAARYGRLDRATCEAELRRRQIGFVSVGE
ncbi:MAG TPA: hypothetical protein VLM85_30185, partial [Polyangiaceae bacterium]|nr:hypothetical protein [Polyangiaceae bacterium]